MLALKYGSFSHDPGECEIVISRQAKVSSHGTGAKPTDCWTISGNLQAGTPRRRLTAGQQMVHDRRAAKGEKDLRRTGIDKYHREGVVGAERKRDVAELHEHSANQRRAKAEGKAVDAGIGSRLDVHADFEHTFKVKIETDEKDLSRRIADKIEPLIEEVRRQKRKIQNLEESQRLNKAGNKNNAKGLS